MQTCSARQLVAWNGPSAPLPSISPATTKSEQNLMDRRHRSKMPKPAAPPALLLPPGMVADAPYYPCSDEFVVV